MCCRCRTCRTATSLSFSAKTDEGSRLSARHRDMMSAKIRFFMCTSFPSNFCARRPPRRQWKRAPFCPPLEIHPPARSCRTANRAAVPLQWPRRVSALPLQPNLFYHKSQCTATFQEELSNKYNVNLPHVFVTICNFWKIFPFTKIKRTVYSKNSQALHFLYLRAEKRPRPPNG